jgi:G:T-mismatch repair DNA endonuclease (very short patch repair protein)
MQPTCAGVRFGKHRDDLSGAAIIVYSHIQVAITSHRWQYHWQCADRERPT